MFLLPLTWPEVLSPYRDDSPSLAMGHLLAMWWVETQVRPRRGPVHPIDSAGQAVVHKWPETMAFFQARFEGPQSSKMKTKKKRDMRRLKRT